MKQHGQFSVNTGQFSVRRCITHMLQSHVTHPCTHKTATRPLLQKRKSHPVLFPLLPAFAVRIRICTTADRKQGRQLCSRNTATGADRQLADADPTLQSQSRGCCGGIKAANLEFVDEVSPRPVEAAHNDAEPSTQPRLHARPHRRRTVCHAQVLIQLSIAPNLSVSVPHYIISGIMLISKLR